MSVCQHSCQPAPMLSIAVILHTCFPPSKGIVDRLSDAIIRGSANVCRLEFVISLATAATLSSAELVIKVTLRTIFIRSTLLVQWTFKAL